MIITSLTNPHIKSLYDLKKNKVKKERQEFIVDGLDFIELAYQKGLLKEILFCDKIEGYEDIKKIEVTPQIIEKLSPNMTPSNVIAVCAYPTLPSISKNKYVYLDGVQDPGNVGTIIRTALAFNYDGVLLSSDCASIYNDKVISATKGALFLIPVYENVTLLSLKDDYQIIVTALQNAVDYKTIDIKDHFIVVMGNEGQGVKKSSIEIADKIVKIDISNIDSLNVAIATGILLNEYRR